MKYTIIHPTAIIGKNTVIEDFTIIGANVIIGSECKIHSNVHIGDGVKIGSRVKIQDNVVIPPGVEIGDGVFIGPSACFTNDKYPRAINPDGSLKSGSDWELSPTVIGYGASICANATIVCGVKIGEWAMIGAGAVVTRDIPAKALALGIPAKVIRKTD
ncbi:MAG: N-acetyltransferase [Muribaculaceae bacterium]|nr:N-acetyltransferase [Muribaculaceae bacterium]MDE6574971.1 N-acetyltransferase [Muribaculaceae bacterium]